MKRILDSGNFFPEAYSWFLAMGILLAASELCQLRGCWMIVNYVKLCNEITGHATVQFVSLPLNKKLLAMTKHKKCSTLFKSPQLLTSLSECTHEIWSRWRRNKSQTQLATLANESINLSIKNQQKSTFPRLLLLCEIFWLNLLILYSIRQYWIRLY